MGNAAMVCGGRGGERAAVTVLQADGNVLTLYSRVRVVDLILAHPNHFVCHSSSLVLLQHGKILPLHTLLIPGEVYFLLPMPGGNRHDAGDEDDDTSSLLHREPPRRRTGSMKFVISSEQFSKIMAGSIKEGRHLQRRRSSTAARRDINNRVGVVHKMPMAPSQQPWRPALSSIEEVAAN